MSVDISPPLILAPPFVEHPAAKARRHAPPPPPTTTRADSYLNRIVASQTLWLTPVLLLQAVLCLRLSNGLADDEALSLNAGHQMIAHLLHGTPSPAFGGYFAGIPSLFAVPAAMLDHVGGPELVRGVNALLVLAATTLIYFAARRIFGQGAAIFAAGCFAINPATIFVARYASVDGLALLTLAAALYFVTKAPQRRLYALAAGGLLATAAAEKYVIVLFIPGALVVAGTVCTLRAGRRRGIRAFGLVAAATVGALAAWAAVGHSDWQGFTANALGGRTITAVSGISLLHQSWDHLGLIAVAGLAAVVVLRDRRHLVAALCGSALVRLIVVLFLIVC
jgi:4-amino-4-deoxy-L-arabinose transferase-like glycosyltransferase